MNMEGVAEISSKEGGHGYSVYSRFHLKMVESKPNVLKTLCFDFSRVCRA